MPRGPFQIVKRGRDGRERPVTSGPMTRRQAQAEIARRTEDIVPPGTYQSRPYNQD